MIALALALITGCETEPQLVCRPGYEAVDGECIEPRPETCTDGVDNDADGLLDCEDDDCLGNPACAETNCSDGVDDDGDGTADCTDADCWSDPECDVKVWLSGANGGRRLLGITYADQFGVGVGCDTTWVESSYSLLGVSAPFGKIRFEGGGAAPTTCEFTVDSSWIRLDHRSGPETYFEQAWAVERSGFAMDAGCPLRTSGFLPDTWFLDLDAETGTTLHAGGSRQDAVWFRLGNGPTTPNDSWQVSSASYSGSCSVRFVHTYQSYLGAPFQAGSEVPVETPGD